MQRKEYTMRPGDVATLRFEIVATGWRRKTFQIEVLMECRSVENDEARIVITAYEPGTPLKEV